MAGLIERAPAGQVLSGQLSPDFLAVEWMRRDVLLEEPDRRSSVGHADVADPVAVAPLDRAVAPHRRRILPASGSITSHLNPLWHYLALSAIATISPIHATPMPKAIREPSATKTAAI